MGIVPVHGRPTEQFGHGLVNPQAADGQIAQQVSVLIIAAQALQLDRFVHDLRHSFDDRARQQGLSRHRRMQVIGHQLPAHALGRSSPIKGHLHVG